MWTANPFPPGGISFVYARGFFKPPFRYSYFVGLDFNTFGLEPQGTIFRTITTDLFPPFFNPYGGEYFNSSVRNSEFVRSFA